MVLTLLTLSGSYFSLASASDQKPTPVRKGRFLGLLGFLTGEKRVLRN